MKWLLLALGALLLLTLGVQASERREFVLTFRPVEKALYYEIQFLNEAPGPDAPATGPVERFSGTTVQRVILPEVRYFRIRAVAERDVPGLWSAAHAVDRYIKAQAQIFRSIQTSAQSSPVLFLVDQSLALRGHDQGAGKLVIFYSLNGAPFAEYRAPLTFDEDGGYSLQWYSVDSVGNKEAPQSAAFYVDRTAPVLSLSFRVPLVMSKGRLFTAPANAFTIRATDAVSGVSGTFCRVLGITQVAPAFAPCPEALNMEDLAPNQGGGVHVLEYFAEDRLGNRSTLNRVEIRRSPGRRIALASLRNMGLPAPAF